MCSIRIRSIVILDSDSLAVLVDMCCVPFQTFIQKCGFSSAEHRRPHYTSDWIQMLSSVHPDPFQAIHFYSSTWNKKCAGSILFQTSSPLLDLGTVLDPSVIHCPPVGVHLLPLERSLRPQAASRLACACDPCPARPQNLAIRPGDRCPTTDKNKLQCVGGHRAQKRGVT